MAVTMKDIAARAGVTRNAVAAVLNNSSGSRVSAAKRAVILTIAKELDYRPSFAARVLKGRRTGLLGFVCSSLYSPFIAELVMELLSESERNGYKLLVFSSALGGEVDVETLGRLLGDGMLEGLFLFGEVQAVADAAIEKAGRSDVSLVVLSGSASNVPSVAFNYRMGMELALKTLMEKGHRRIAFAGSTEDLRKRQTYSECCVSSGVVPTVYEYGQAGDLESICAAGRSIVAALDAQTALIGTDYGISIMANELFKRGVRIPKDLSLLAFNNSFLCSSFNPPLTAISIDKVLMARKALELMSRSISGKAPCDPERFLIEPELVWRESVAEPN